MQSVIPRVKQLFGERLGGVAYIIHVIEFQKRGLPHSHIILCLNRPPTLVELPDFISAQLPPESDLELRNLVQTLMHHNCSPQHCIRNGVCKKRFSGKLIDHAYIDQFGYTHYQ